MFDKQIMLQEIKNDVKVSSTLWPYGVLARPHCMTNLFFHVATTYNSTSTLCNSKKNQRIKSKSSIGGKLTGPQLPPTSMTKSRESKEQKTKKEGWKKTYSNRRGNGVEMQIWNPLMKISRKNLYFAKLFPFLQQGRNRLPEQNEKE